MQTLALALYCAVKESDGAGRYLVAARTIAPGELILTDLPLVCGPVYTRCRPCCLGCLRLAVTTQATVINIAG